jgi:hypothetical protein
MSSNLYDAISDCLDRVATRAWTIFGGSPNPEPLKIDKKEDLKDLKV